MNHNKEILNRFLTEKVAIALRTKEEWDDFMELLEKETDLTWGPEVKPTEFDDWVRYKEETSIIKSRFSGRAISFDSCAYHEEESDYKIVEFKELIKDKEMNLADKLRFLADRWEDGKDFYIGSVRYSLNKGELIGGQSGFKSNVKINELVNLDLKLAPQWEFTEDEKVILRNLPEKFTWLARDVDDDLTFFTEKPYKKNNYWGLKSTEIDYLYSPFKRHLFQSIQWSDDEPCEFRKYL